MLTEKAAMYSTLGISKEVFAFGTKIEEELKERFAKIDEIAEYNQLKVIHAMQASKVSEACLYGTTGYGYNDLGRDTLEQVYATCFGTEDALVRPQIACGTHALATALSGNLRPGDELAVAVIDHTDDIWFDIFNKCNQFTDAGNRKRRSGLISFRPLNRHHLCLFVDGIFDSFVIERAVLF